ncbi:hypothetical protein EG328_005878 [Venturia inaequalis]|uniref:Bystin-domain-containing protein n=1 Tax=Venturia inaequalis TaxID=5025 RepID=A0A8H3VCV9_VENIN|nr:hypothetical protein EG328_005878 [Venturia inaequalis]RDI77181.1 hypothetical protein Vi05172_g12848 [Venturia inaequalis]
MPKIPRPAQTSDRHNPLAEEYSGAQSFKTKAPKKRSRKDEEDEDAVVGTKASRQILKIGQELIDEDEEERRLLRAEGVTVPNPAFSFESRVPHDVDSEEETEKYDGEGEEAWGEEEETFEVEEIDANDLDTFNKFLPPSFDDPILRPGEEPLEQPPINLADKILAAIAQHEAAQNGGQPDEGIVEDEEDVQLPPAAVETYTQVGLMMSRYKSGKLSKPFKILPTLPPQILGLIIPLTRPDEWTPNAILAATRLFISSNSVTSEAFLKVILLERVREDIAESKKLNIHLYNAIKKSLYKPKDFFRGFLFPLVESGTCTLREAAIISSALTRVSIPVLHSAYALARLCEIAAEQMSVDTEAGGATNVFIKTLLEKRYALPYQTIDALVFHFLRFRPVMGQPLPSQAEAMELDGDQRTGDFATRNGGISGRRLNQQKWLPSRDQGIMGKLPVIWHQCLLAFSQRYRDEITEDQREALLDLLLAKGHKDIGPEVRRELLAGRGRGVVPLAPEVGGEEMAVEIEGGDDTMMG